MDEELPVAASLATEPGGFLAWLLVAAGALAVLLCGVCSGAFIAADLSDPCRRAGTAECADDYRGIVTAFALYLGVAPVLLGGAGLAAGLQRLGRLSQGPSRWRNSSPAF